MIVLDAAAAVEYLTEPAEIGEWVRTAIEREQEVAAPHVIDLEVISAIRKKLLRKDITHAAASAAVGDLEQLALARYPVTEFIPRIWELRRTLTPYDASYVVLAEALNSTLITTDERLARSHGHRATIESP